MTLRHRYPSINLLPLSCLCCLILMPIFLPTAFSSGGKYLYAGDKNAGPVIEFMAVTDGVKESVPDPDFLSKMYTKDRIVEFYSPWCGHCQHFKPLYIELAKLSFLYLSPDVEFHAVSCSEHGDVCRDQGVKSYPTLKAFKKGSATGEILKRDRKSDKLTINAVAEAFGIAFEAPENGTEQNLKATNDNKVQNVAVSYESEVKSKEDTFADALRSFVYSLQSGVYVENGPLKDQRLIALFQWLELLQISLPVEWKSVHYLLDDLRSNFSYVSQGNGELLKVLDRHKHIDAGSWSRNCKKGKEGMGYTCGLWELFHVFSVGMHERYEEIVAYPEEHMSASSSALVLRNFIEHFFACEVCRANFLKQYDACEFDRCNRLLPETNYSTKEVALWIWEVHNSVSGRLLKEEGERYNRHVTDEERYAVTWPSKMQCPKCWGDKTWPTWDRGEVFEFLKKTYWLSPESDSETIKRLDIYIEEAAFGLDVTEQFYCIIFASVFFLAVLLLYRKRRQRNIRKKISELKKRHNTSIC